MSTNSEAGRFKPTPEGVKTPKMLEVEKMIGSSLEKDFEEYHIKKGWGQHRLAKRWGVSRSLIFSTTMRGGRRSWVEMLKLNTRRIVGNAPAKPQPKLVCELCNAPESSLDRAHWVSHRDGGSASAYNILNLCPNCHRRLDRDDEKTKSTCREILLFRESRRIIEGSGGHEAKRRKLVDMAKAILERKPYKIPE